jgi:hypothetical protein
MEDKLLIEMDFLGGSLGGEARALRLARRASR